METLKNYTQTTVVLSLTTFSDRELTLEKYLEHFVTDILKTKDKKYYSDRLAYETSTAYKWSTMNSRKRNKPSSRGHNSAHDPSDSDESSISSSPLAGANSNTLSDTQKRKFDRSASTVSAAKRTPQDTTHSGLRLQTKNTPSCSSNSFGDGHSNSLGSGSQLGAIPKVSHPPVNTPLGDSQGFPNLGDLRIAPIFSLTPNLENINKVPNAPPTLKGTAKAVCK